MTTKELNLGKNKKYLVVGAGLSGLASLEYFLSKGLDVEICDTREGFKSKGLASLKDKYPEYSDLNLQHTSAVDFNNNYYLAVVSPGISPSDDFFKELSKKSIPIISEIELFALSIKESNTKIIAITGTNGKSTVTSLVYSALKSTGYSVAIGGNIGVPTIALVTNQDIKDYYVIEISSAQLECTYSLAPEVAVFLNFSCDHLDRYLSMDDYLAAKIRIFNNANYAVYNKEDINTYPKGFSSNKTLSFALSKESEPLFYLSQDSYLCHENEKIISSSSFNLKGKHNTSNILATFAVFHALNIPISKILKPIMEFKALDHRTVYIGGYGNRMWINDSKATNVGSCISAVKGLKDEVKGKIVLILGGQRKGASLTELLDIAKYLKAVVVFGQDGDYIADIFSGSLPVYKENNIANICAKAFNVSEEGDLILFSPACASFDMFDNFEHRGETYTMNVQALFENESIPN